MKKHIGKKFLPLCSAALAVLLGLSACGRSASPPAPAASAGTVAGSGAQAPTESAEVSTPERAISCTILLSGKETEAFLDVSNGTIAFWDQASAGNLLAEAAYPEEIPAAAEALDSWDLTDLDGDGNSDLAVWFRFEDGTSASLLWFFTDGGFVYNEEFSQLPGNAAMGEASPE